MFFNVSTVFLNQNASLSQNKVLIKNHIEIMSQYCYVIEGKKIN